MTQKTEGDIVQQRRFSKGGEGPLAEEGGTLFCLGRHNPLMVLKIGSDCLLCASAFISCYL